MSHAEKLIILRQAGNALLASLGTTKKVLSSPGQKPGLFSDQQFTKLLSSISKKFPDIDGIEKTQGFEQLVQKSKIFYPEIEPFYFHFVDSLTFRDQVLQTLNEIGNDTVEMKMEVNPTFTVAFMDVFRIYVQVTLLIHDITERKQILGVFTKLYKAVKFADEPNYLKTSQWVASLDNPVKALQNDFRNLTNFLGKALVELAPVYNAIRGTPLLRKNGVLNLALKPEEMARPVTDKLRFNLMFSEEMFLWIYYGFLVCPDSLSLPGAIDLNVTILREGFVLPIFNQSTTQLHGEFENLWSSSKNKGFLQQQKQKKIKIKEVIDESAQKSALLHKTRRIFLRQELNTLYNIVKDSPGVLAPKFQVVLSGLSMAKEEIFWYIRHNNKEARASKRFPKISDTEFLDHSIAELIYLSVSLGDIVVKHQDLIKSYYCEYLRGTDANSLFDQLTPAFKESVPKPVVDICLDIHQQISGASETSDFRTLRLNWLRAEASLSSIKSTTKLTKFQGLVDRMHLILWHTRYVDSLHDLLDEYGRLHGLWYWKENFNEIFSNTIKAPQVATFTGSLLQVITDFPRNGNIYNAGERDEIGKQIVNLMNEKISEITARIVMLFSEIVRYSIHLQGGLREVNAIAHAQMRRPDWKAPKGWTAPALPGEESGYRERKTQNHESILTHRNNLDALLSALQAHSKLQVWDQLFSLPEFVADALTKCAKNWIRNSVANEVTDEKHTKEPANKVLNRPSYFLADLKIFINNFCGLQETIDFDPKALLRNVLLNEVYLSGLGHSGTLEWATADETEFKPGQTIIGHAVAFYQNFLEKHLTSDPHQGAHVIWSDKNMSFVSKAQHPFRAEQYSSINELVALVDLIGSYGVRLIDREILKFVLKQLTSLKDTMNSAKGPLTELAGCFKVEQTAGEALKKIKPQQLDTFTHVSITLGNALKFRECLYAAVARVAEDRVPLIQALTSTLCKEYHPNLFSVAELTLGDCLASELGLGANWKDQALKKFISKIITPSEAQFWDLLPVMFAASFNSTVWKQAVFKPAYGGYQSGAHVIATTISSLFVLVKTLTTKEMDPSSVTNSLVMFLDISAMILMRMGRNSARPDKHGPTDFSSMLIFLDTVVNEAPLLSSRTLNDAVSYNRLRNEFRNVLATKGKNLNLLDQF